MFTTKQVQGNWPVVMARAIIPEVSNESHLMGYFSYVNGKVEPLDDNNWTLDNEWCRAEIGTDEDGSEYLILTTYNHK